MRRNQLDLATSQPRLLTDEIRHEPIGSDYSRVRRLPLVSDSPIPHENEDGINPLMDVAILFDHAADFCGIRNRLIETIVFFRTSIDEQSFAVPETNLSRATPEFRLDGEDSSGADNNVIDIESVALQIMKRLVTESAKSLQDFRHMQLSSLTAIQSAELVK